MRAALCDSCNWLPTGLQRVPLSFIRADTGTRGRERERERERALSSALSSGCCCRRTKIGVRDEGGRLERDASRRRRGGYVKIIRAMRETRVRERRRDIGRSVVGMIGVGGERERVGGNTHAPGPLVRRG